MKCALCRTAGLRNAVRVRGAGSVVTWRRAQMVLLSAQGMAVVKIAKPEPAEHALPFSKRLRAVVNRADVA
ncbi:hypothetical protein GCM10010294_61810 [Streptomyces griseoloalbus]|nr:hypothetical protein GCM10010294_61810 [Streptomyces griseoloalbus]